MKDRGITDLVTSIALPTSNGAAERAVRSVKRLLWSWHAVRRLPWASLCAAVAKQLNTTNRRVLGAGKTPAELLQKAREDALDPRIKRLSTVAKGRGNSLIYNSILRPGDKVRLSLAYWGDQQQRNERDTSKLGKSHCRITPSRFTRLQKKLAGILPCERSQGTSMTEPCFLKSLSNRGTPRLSRRDRPRYSPHPQRYSRRDRPRCSPRPQTDLVERGGPVRTTPMPIIDTDPPPPYSAS